MIENEPLDLSTWDDWFYVLAKFPKRLPRHKRLNLPLPIRPIPTEQINRIIDLIISSKMVIGVDARLLTNQYNYD